MQCIYGYAPFSRWWDTVRYSGIQLDTATYVLGLYKQDIVSLPSRLYYTIIFFAKHPLYCAYIAQYYQLLHSPPPAQF